MAQCSSRSRPTCLVLVVAAALLAVPVSACVCPAVYEPVCGADGRDYSNTCAAGCAGAAVASAGPCPEAQINGSSPVCACPRIMLPVCGVSGVTHSNDCTARCAGDSVAHSGACKGATVEPRSGAEQQLAAAPSPAQPDAVSMPSSARSAASLARPVRMLLLFATAAAACATSALLL
jgi:Kazal-type serine protease inhibitor domain